MNVGVCNFCERFVCMSQFCTRTPFNTTTQNSHPFTFETTYPQQQKYIPYPFPTRVVFSNLYVKYDEPLKMGVVELVPVMVWFRGKDHACTSRELA